MTLDEFIHKFRDNCDGAFTLPKCRLAIDTFIKTLTDDVMIPRDTIRFKEFGQFGAKSREGHIGRNPKTKEEFKVPKRYIPYFDASDILKDMVKGR